MIGAKTRDQEKLKSLDNLFLNFDGVIHSKLG